MEDSRIPTARQLTVRLPAAFAADHAYRTDDRPDRVAVVAVRGTVAIVRGTVAALDDLLNDAEFYGATPPVVDAPLSLRRSAARVAEILRGVLAGGAP